MKALTSLIAFIIGIVADIFSDFDKRASEYQSAFQSLLDKFKAENKKFSVEDVLSWANLTPQKTQTTRSKPPEDSDLIEIKRIYHPEYTGGEAYYNGNFVSQSLELAWRNNQRSISCIPEGTYEVVKRHTPKRGWHLHVTGVPNRSWILIHVMNDVTLNQELDGDQDADSAGCIGFADALTIKGGNMVGVNSTSAIKRLNDLAFANLDKNRKLFIKISDVNEQQAV